MGLVIQFPNRGELYGMLAFAGTGLGAFSIFPFASRLRGEAWEVALTFFLGGTFIVLGVLSRYIVDDRPYRHSVIYALIQTALGLTAVWVSPISGLFNILLLPLASQCIFIFNWRVSLTWGLGLYTASCGIYGPRYGWDGFFEALISYSPAYLFTMVFSYVTRDALVAREQAMELTDELEGANAKLRAHAAQAEALATTRERNRLAREIHDGVGHYLTVINVQLEAARTLLPRDPNRASAAIDKAVHLSREALEDVRRSVGSLRSEDQRPPLAESLHELSRDAGVPVEIEISGPPRPLSSAINHALFRAAQEGLTNVRKHAAASQSWVRLDFADPGRTRLIIEDDGRGAPPLDGTPGFGLKGMHERIELLGGSVTTQNRSQGGFALRVEVPA